MKKKALIKLLPFLFLLSSCLGLSTDIQMNRNGSGRITMEYRLSVTAESIGRLDGNERWPIIPVGRADWERSIQRLDGIKLVSFSSRERSNDIITRVILDYENTSALINLLGRDKASFSQGRLDYILIKPLSEEIDADLLELMRQASSGYKFSISFTADSNCVLVLTDGTLKGIPAPSGCEIVSSGRKVSFSIDIGELFTLTGGFGISIRW
jgi:hypothetical protein